MYDITVIGAAIIDVLAAPVGSEVFRTGSQAMKEIRLSYGGDALNEAIVLSRLGKHVQLVGTIGNDTAGDQILRFLWENDISSDSICVRDGLATGINIVLVDAAGERYFLTNPHGSLRHLRLEDILPALPQAAPIVSFASMFVSPLLDIHAMTTLFRHIKSSGRTLVCDTTKAKNGETLSDLQCLLPYIDVFLTNESEAALLTGEQDPAVNARLLREAGVKTAVVKCGAAGCIAAEENGLYRIPAVPNIRCVDSTGAGDAFAGGFLTALSDGLDTADCARFACATASCAIEQIGASDGVTSPGLIRQRYEFLKRS